MRRKIVALLLVIALLFTCALPMAFAEDEGDSAAAGYIMTYTMPVGTTGSNVQYMGHFDNNLHMAYSTDGETWETLFDNKGVLFYAASAAWNSGIKGYRDIFVFQKPDGTFVLLATPLNYNGATHTASLLYYDSTDFINWNNQKTIAVSSGSVYPTVPQVKYDQESGEYTIIWTASNGSGVFYNKTTDFSTFTSAAAYEGGDYPMDTTAGVDVSGKPESALLGSIVPVSEEILDGVLARFKQPTVPTGTDELTVTTVEGVEANLPTKGTVNYSDGTSEKRNIIYDEESLAAVDYNTPGTYEVTGLLEGMPDYKNPYNKNGADPDIFKGPDGKYYYTSSYMDPTHNGVGSYQYDRIAIRTAATVAGLATAEERFVFWRKTSGPASYHIWAPEIRYVKFAGEEQGQWVIYFAGGKTSSNYDLHVYAITCDSQDPMTGNWSDIIEIAAMRGADGSDDRTGTSFDLDATVFEHYGEWYMIWASKPSTSNVVISKMTSATSVEIPKGGITLSSPTYTWENRRDRVLEGGTIMKRNGMIYVGVAAGSTDATYCLGLLYCKDDPDVDILDPANWTKLPYPLMIANPGTSQYGPGHATFTVAEDGVTPLLSYYARPTEAFSGISGYNPLYDANRYARIAQIYFQEDGTPYYGIPPVDGYLPGSEVTVKVVVEEEVVPTPNVAWYTFDEMEEGATTVPDRSGKGNHATLGGNDYMVQSGLKGDSLVLNSTGTNRTGHAVMPSGAFDEVEDFTVATWINMRSFSSWARIFDFGKSSTTGYMFMMPGSSASGNMQYTITRSNNANEQSLSFRTPLVTSRWTHVAVTQRGDTITMYVDGVEYASKSGFTNNPANSIAGGARNYIGRSQFSGDTYLRATLDDFRVYDYALDDGDIFDIMTLSTPRAVASVSAVEDLTTTLGSLPELPTKVSVTYDDGTTGVMPVTWLDADPLKTYEGKEFTLYGSVGGTDLQAQVKIIVSSMALSDDYAVNVKADVSTNTVVFDVKNFTSGSKTINLVGAIYNQNNTLMAIKSQTVTLAANDYVSQATLQLTLPAGFDEDLYTIKGFVWSNTLQPLSDAGVDTYMSDVMKVANSFTIPNQNDIRGNITLPDTLDGATIDWASSDESVISTAVVENAGYDPTPAGVVNRDPKGDKVVVLTGTFTLDGRSIVKKYNVTVTKKPESAPKLAGYLLAGFANNGSRDIQQIHFSLSQDGNYYSDLLNGGEPVITSDMGTKGLRDPHIIRSPEGDRFYMIATDLDASGGAWGEYSTNGSKYIMIWESEDLVNWSNQRMIKVAPDNVGNCWAPESVYDPITGEYIVFWSSRNIVTGNGHWIMYAKTRDFVTFTPAQVFTSQSTTGIIDSTIIYDDISKYYYRYTKWEYSASGFSGNSIYVERARQLLHTDWEWVTPGQMIVSGGYEGPAIFKYNNENRWGLMIDEYATGQRRRFVPMYSTDLTTGKFSFPAAGEFQMPTDKRACHGVVLPITQKEYDAIAAKWGTPVYKNRPY